MSDAPIPMDRFLADTEAIVLATQRAGAEAAVRRLLHFLGEDPDRDGLRDTPRRVVSALMEMTEGGSLDPASVLGTTFDVPYDQMVVVAGIEFTSLCEHHLLPFEGEAVVGYLPTDRVVGLSKIARLVEAYARRLQVQERMTQQIAQTMQDVLSPSGVGVVLRARHSCMACRGIRKRADMVTSALLGAMRDDGQAREEFLALSRA